MIVLKTNLEEIYGKSVFATFASKKLFCLDGCSK
jgi:hypothetical protein